MLTPVHDADHDGAGLGSNFDEIQTGICCGLAGLFEGDDADLFAAGTDQADGTQTDLIVDSNLGFD
jgi:hypothetical protein